MFTNDIRFLRIKGSVIARKQDNEIKVAYVSNRGRMKRRMIHRNREDTAQNKVNSVFSPEILLET